MCGYPSDTGGRYDLWDRVQVCEGTKPGPPFPQCLRTTPTYVILIVPVWGLTSTGAPVPRSYRVLHVANLNTNLFTLLRDSVVRPTGSSMAAQILAVTPRLVGNGGFYVLNSEPGLPVPPGQPGGTGTVDFLLAYA